MKHFIYYVIYIADFPLTFSDLNDRIGKRFRSFHIGNRILIFEVWTRDFHIL